ncbi:exodeoxyribonuclease VII large subunit, partial [bacterium]
TRRLAALSPEATLRRGYAHVSRARDGRAVGTIGDVRSGDAIRVRVIDGAFDAVVTGQGRLFD